MKEGLIKMLNNIKISQTTNEIILNVNVIAEINEILEELQTKIPKLRDFYQTSKIPMRVTGRLFTNSEIEKIKSLINNEIQVEIKFDDVSDLLGLHAIKRTFEVGTEISETKFVQNSLRSGQKEEYPGSIVICGDVNAGAEIIAGGNIMILGTLRGVAHAGANGNTMAIISANHIDVTQIRIANLVREVGEKIDRCPICKIEKNEIVIS
jgi:septum site-determining protein MinC